MQLSDFEIIRVLAEEKNMRKAAERLFVSQPALSQRLKSIEREWKAPLFIRSKRGLVLTSEGEKVNEFSRRTIKEEEHLKDEIAAHRSEINGTLKIAVSSVTAQYWLPKLLKKYVEAHPLVKISMITGWSSEILKQMYDSDTHIGIVRGNPKWRGKKHHLFSDPLYLVDTSSDSLETLSRSHKPYIQYKSDASYHEEIEAWWMHHYNRPQDRTIIVDQIETCKQMALNGIGYAILPGISLAEEKQPAFKIPLDNAQGEVLKRDTWLLTHETSLQLKQVQAFVDLIQEKE